MTRRHPAMRLVLHVVVVLMVMASLGCGQKLVFPRLEFKSEESKTPSIPLTVRVEIPDALKQAQLFYKDSCGAPQGIPLGERLAEQIKADVAGVFEKTFEGSPREPADAVLSAVMETGEISLNIPRRETSGEYKMTVLVKLRITVIDTEGKTLFNEAVKGEGKWNVTTDGIECAPRGLMLPVTEAMEKLSDRTVDGLTQAIKIRDYAIKIRTRQEMMALSKQGGSAVAPPAGTGTADPPTLSFRASLEDENRNQVLDAGEKLVVRVEVANSGPGVARGVTVVLSGTPALVKEFTNPTMLGDLQPGEKKQAMITSTLPASLPEQQAELLVQVTEAGGFGPPTKKRFVATVQQGSGGTAADAGEVLSGDVDQIPPRVTGFERRTSYAVVVGIGGYREENVPKLKYAKHDAEVVAKHLTAVAGFPSENVRILTDERALLVDLQEIFEEWLPQKANSSGVVLVYLVGNGILNADSGEIVLVPYEGRQDLARRGYSLRRLQEVLGRLPSRLNLVFADLSFPGANEGSGAGPRTLSWISSRPGGKSRIVIIGSSSTNGPSLSWDAGQHGLFSYSFLRAIRGQADVNDNGWVDVGEIIAYLREQVPKGAAELKKQQVPVVSPEVEPDGPIGTFPVSKARRRG
jgi:hypothetical protein